jgi:NRAMP (natural resistance-associated macrophage protein)-like metal ion transporter
MARADDEATSRHHRGLQPTARETPLLVRTPIKLKSFLRALGPGLITGASDADPSGIATYSQAGAQFGYAMLWTMLFCFPFMTAIQEISARVGRVTGHGIGGNMRAIYPTWLTYGIALAVFFANTINIGADIAAMGDVIRMVAGGSAVVYTLFIVLVSAGIQIAVPYRRCAPILKWLTLVLFTYVATAFFVEVPWRTAIWRTVFPHLSSRFDYLLTFVAVLGTTISPYLFFWQASLEAENVRLRHSHPLRQDGAGASRAMRRIQIDTYFGMAVSNVIGFFIMLTCAATLHAKGIVDIESASQAAHALRPIAGPGAALLFAAGIVGTGLLAVPVLAGSAAYAVSRVAGWRSSLAEAPKQTAGFYSTLALATLLGATITLTPANPMKALYWSAVVNGIVAGPPMTLTILLASDRRVMGEFLIPAWLKVLGWMSAGLMYASVLVLMTSSLT